MWALSGLGKVKASWVRSYCVSTPKRYLPHYDLKEYPKALWCVLIEIQLTTLVCLPTTHLPAIYANYAS